MTGKAHRFADPIARRDRQQKEAVAMITTNPFGVGIVLALALATSAAPAAARPYDLTTPNSYSPAQQTGAALAHDARTRSVAAAGAGYGYGYTPSASTGSHDPRSEVVSGDGYATPSAPPTVVRVVAPDDGFDWGDAGIGAAGGLALSMIGLGTALAVSQHRTRRPATPHA